MTMKEDIFAGLDVYLTDLGEDALRYGQTCLDLVTGAIAGALIAAALWAPNAGKPEAPRVGLAVTASTLPSCGRNYAAGAGDAADPGCIETLVLAPAAS